MVRHLLEEHRDRIQEIAARHGARNVRVFGSLARGSGGEDSDLDLLISKPGLGERSGLAGALLMATMAVT